ncbi:DUF805 domain-containing protein [Erythrobacter sp. SDW2]|uniref:DUF805 domain-containing protein n=1 Tax=Erythrobacter sp. SDW2 TaxID=2907154 RepID=UPI001F30245D|nr:DUF805 domain-containing protein [Erythrobacter sp. SDW2]UIP07904.1 DUF805 domain-containing protein [Erythrobacter sp. SDW2]
MHWMLLPFKRYADFGGRSRRMEFWMFSLLGFLVAVATVGLAMAVAPGAGESEMISGDGGFQASAAFNSDFSGSPLAMVLVGVYGLFVLAAFIPGIAVTVRRLHDRDMSGWWYLGAVVAGLLPLIGIFVWLAFFVLMLLPGTTGPNRFGPDPKGDDLEEVFG